MLPWVTALGGFMLGLLAAPFLPGPVAGPAREGVETPTPPPGTQTRQAIMAPVSVVVTDTRRRVARAGATGDPVHAILGYSLWASQTDRLAKQFKEVIVLCPRLEGDGEIRLVSDHAAMRVTSMKYASMLPKDLYKIDTVGVRVIGVSDAGQRQVLYDGFASVSHLEDTAEQF